jgi:isopentenyl diphosphate isomerase/L-lactate dehydrogenase-like FMN-dependent dehydrogenase
MTTGRMARTPDEISDVHEFERIAKSRANALPWAYISGGADSMSTLHRNIRAFDWVTVNPGIPCDVKDVKLSTTVLGVPLAIPFMVGPMSGQSDLHPAGDAETYRGATAAGAAMVVPNYGLPVADVTKAAKGTPFFQLYHDGDQATEKRVGNAIDSGCHAIFFTVDEPYPPHHLALLRVQKAGGPPPRLEAVKCRLRPLLKRYGLGPMRSKFTWADFDKLRRLSSVPVVIKGILTAQDARLAVEHGAAGVVVSTHGGRSQDLSEASLEALPEVVDAVKGKIAIFVDSGFRRGPDILKALGMGADFVLIGRPILWGLGAFGAPGVKRVIEILRNELVAAMAQQGWRSVASIDRSLVKVDFA